MNANPLLRSPVPPELREEWAAHLARRPETQLQGQLAVLSFRLGAEVFCLPARCIEEISAVDVIRPLPHTQKGLIRGITNVRGRIRLCVWLDRLLQVLPSDQVSVARLVLFAHEGWRVAAVVDEVIGADLLDPAGRLPLPATHAGAVFGEGWFAAQGVALLNETKFFNGLRQQLR